MQNTNASQAEINKFSSLASSWWDPQGELKSLHDINPLRLDWIRTQVDNLDSLKILDIGCGGGLLTEAMALEGANVTGIDLAGDSLEIAKLHGLESNVDVNYECISAEDYAKQHADQFDLVSCMELLEHVPNPASIIQASANLVKPGGIVVFSTLNRNLKSFLGAILAAEYVLRMVPKGTHSYEKFITPSELGTMARKVGLEVSAIAGISYQPISKTYNLSNNTSINYMMAARRPN